MVGAADGWLRRDIYMQLIHNIAPGLIYKAEAGEAKFTDAPFVEAMRWWKRLFDDGVIQPGALGLSAYPGSMELIEAGRAAMFPMGAWWAQQAARPNPPPLSAGLSGYRADAIPGRDRQGCARGPSRRYRRDDRHHQVGQGPGCGLQGADGLGRGDAAQVLINSFNDLPAVKGITPRSLRRTTNAGLGDVDQLAQKVRTPGSFVHRRSSRRSRTTGCRRRRRRHPRSGHGERAGCLGEQPTEEAECGGATRVAACPGLRSLHKKVLAADP